MSIFSDIKEKLNKSENIEEEFTEAPRDEYVELRTDEVIESEGHMLVRPFTLEDFEDIRHVIDALREGHVIAIINIKTLKEKDINELKRAIAKLRKTCDALDGEIAGFTEDIVIATSSSAKIHKTKNIEQLKED